MDIGENPDRKGFTDRPVLRRFFPPGPEVTKWTTEFFELRAKINQLNNDIQAQRGRGDIEAANETLAENKNFLKFRRRLNRMGTQLSAIRARKRRIMGDTEMSGEEKRAQLNDLDRRQNTIVLRTKGILAEIRALEESDDSD